MKLAVEKDSYLLLAAIAALTLVFIGSSIYANWRTLAIDLVAEELENDALPDIEHTSAAANALNKIEAAADDYPEVASAEREGAKQDIQRALQTVDAELDAYLALPSVEGERTQLGDLRGSLGQVHEAVQGLFDEVDLDAGPTHTEAAVRRTRGAVEHVIGSLRRVMRFSVSEARTRIAHVGRLAGRLAGASAAPRTDTRRTNAWGTTRLRWGATIRFRDPDRPWISPSAMA